jgi:hypothetical protein
MHILFCLDIFLNLYELNSLVYELDSVEYELFQLYMNFFNCI